MHCETLTGLETIVRSTDLAAAMPVEVVDARAAAAGLLMLRLTPAPRAHTLNLIRWAEARPTPAAAELADLFLAEAGAARRSRAPRRESAERRASVERHG